jgi:hypothetical protein
LPDKKLKNSASICDLKSLKKKQQIGYRIQQAKIVLAAIGERGVMKIKILGFALILGLAAVLGACEGGGETPGGGAGTATTPAEPADGAGGAMSTPGAGGSMSTPGAGDTTTTPPAGGTTATPTTSASPYKTP